MELRELLEKTLDLFEIDDVSKLSENLMQVVIHNDTEKYSAFVDIVKDLSIDWLQKIFQYYEADRKNKMQDYTPTSLARFMGMLAGNSDTVIDMCAGSGALTIQRWNLNNETEFLLYEFDKKVIPFLLFNMALRNIKCVVCHSDVLQQEVYHTYSVKKGERFGVVKEEDNELHINF